MSKPSTRVLILLVCFLLAAALFSGAVGGWLLHPHASTDGKPAAEAATVDVTSSPDSAQLYTCSMHPQVRSTNPNDKCPICGMALIPVPSDGGRDDRGALPSLRVTRRAAALMQVQVHPVERRKIPVTVRVFGRLGYDQTRLRTISAWTSGRLDKLHVDYIGESVVAGQPIAEMYSPQLVAAQEEFLQALASVRQMDQQSRSAIVDAARSTVDAARDRLELLGLPGDAIAAIEAAGDVRDHVEVLATVSGVVLERLATHGDYVDVGQPIYRLADLSNLWLQLDVYEADLPWLRLGQNVRFTTQSQPDHTFDGTIAFIDPLVSEGTRTVRVRVNVPNVDGQLKPGMFVRGEIESTATASSLVASTDSRSDPEDHSEHEPAADAEGVLVIPATAPLLTGQRAVVYVQNVESNADQPVYEMHEVLLGPKVGAWYVVRRGLEEGELVVTHGAFQIDSELQIRGRPSMMQAPQAQPAIHSHASDPQASADGDARRLVSHAFQKELGQIVRTSAQIADALAAEDDASAATLASALRSNLTHMHQADDVKWQATRDALERVAASLDEAKDLASRRVVFAQLNASLKQAIETFGVRDTDTIYVVSCPMVNQGEAFWLQYQPTIRNPYMGASMLDCGQIINVVNAADHPGEEHR